MRSVSLTATLIAVALAVGAASAAKKPPQPTWRSLHRSLHIPRIAPGTRATA